MHSATREAYFSNLGIRRYISQKVIGIGLFFSLGERNLRIAISAFFFSQPPLSLDSGSAHFLPFPFVGVTWKISIPETERHAIFE